MLLAGGPRLFERLVEETAAGTAVLVPRAPSPALVAHLIERDTVVSPGTRVGDCTSVEESVPKRSPTQALFDAERKLWELEDDDHDEELESSAAEDAAEEPGPTDASCRPVRRTYPRGSPPPRAGRSPRRTTRRK